MSFITIKERFGRYWHVILLVVGLILSITGALLAGTPLDTTGYLLFLLGLLSLGIAILYVLSLIVHKIRGN